MADCFISYRRIPSAAVAIALQSKLESEHGIDAYVDATRTDGTRVRFPERLMTAIADARVFICLLGERDGQHTLESEWVLKEIQQAYDLQKFCVPVFQESYRPLPDIPPAVDYLLGFDGVHILDEMGIMIDESVKQLAEMIRPDVKRRIPRVIFLGVLLIVAIGVIFAVLTQSNQGVGTDLTPDPTTAVVKVGTQTPTDQSTVLPTSKPTVTYTDEPTATSTDTPSRTPTRTPRPTATLPAISSRDYVFDLLSRSIWDLNDLRRENMPNAYRITGDDPYIQMDQNIALGLCLGDYSHVYVQMNAPSGKTLEMYYVLNDPHDYYNEQRHLVLDYTRGGFQTTVFPISSIPQTRETDHLMRIRLDFVNTIPSDLIYIFDFRLISSNNTNKSRCDLPTITANP